MFVELTVSFVISEAVTPRQQAYEKTRKLREDKITAVNAKKDASKKAKLAALDELARGVEE